MTVNDLITASLRRLRVISGADPPSGDDMNDALLRLQDWIDDLQSQEFLQLFTTGTYWPLLPGKTIYECPDEVGVPAIAPKSVLSIGYRDAAGIDYLVGQPPLTDDGWALIPNKNVAGPRPSYFYVNGGAGLLTPGYKTFIRPWPTPNVAGLTGYITFGQPVSQMTLSTVLDGGANLPPGWRRFLRDGLALELAPEFHVSDPAVLGPLKLSADESKANIKRMRRPLRDLATPEWFGSGGGSGNIYTG